MDKSQSSFCIDSKHIKLFALVILCIIFVLSFTRKINLINSDLGRHIKNGELVFEDSNLLNSNYYSYTEPEYETINHHWGSGVIFYYLNKLVGFKGLSIIYTLLSTIILLLFIFSSKRKKKFILVFFLALLSIPLITSRAEIRPEGLSYLFLGIYYYILTKYNEGKLNYKFLYIFPFLQAFWVNLHLFFILGLFVIGVFIIDSLINSKDKLKQLVIVFFLSLLACLINPNGLRGILAPLNIFDNYGYMLAENQSVFFMQKRFSSFFYIHFELLIILTVILILLLIIKKKFIKYLSEAILLIAFGILGIRMVRTFPLFGLFLISCGSNILNELSELLSNELQSFLEKILVMLSVIIIIIFVLIPNQYFSIFNYNSGIDLWENNLSSSEFFKKNKLTGPIFNNYDIGGYLIYNLFPEEELFVDNRPEAYSVEFMENTYIKMQENEERWKKIDNQYNFNAIFFYRLDMTPWAQEFLIKRVEDDDWAPVYVDDWTIIFVRRVESNNTIINQFEIPEYVFGKNKY